MTTAGSSHHDVTWARTSRLVTIRATTTAAAMVQSSPMIKSYQNLPKPIRKDIRPSLRRRLQRQGATPAQHVHKAERDDDVHNQYGQDRRVGARPVHASALRRPEGAER